MKDKKFCVVCPVCGAVDEFDVDDIYVMETFGETYMIERYVGQCLNCETDLQWEQVYELVCVQNVQEVNPRKKEE